MRLLHSSDWHIGHTLYGKKRHDEFSSFLTWLTTILRQQAVDLLVVAGDIFDSSTPGSTAQGLYYQFLARIPGSGCRHVIIIGGNHDSPGLLEAPATLLKTMNIHVLADLADDPAHHVILLKTPDGNPEAIICAVPYLRDSRLRRLIPGEASQDKNAKLINGIRQTYEKICSIGLGLQSEQELKTGIKPPILATGHLFTAGCSTDNEEGVRDLYVGSLGIVNREIFPASLDYLALGHLHREQTVTKNPRFRYCGSPLPMSFSEAEQHKSVTLVDFNGSGVSPLVRKLPVPCFQPLMRIQGSLSKILGQLEEIASSQNSTLIEVEYTGRSWIPDLREQLFAALKGSRHQILRIKGSSPPAAIPGYASKAESLEAMTPEEVFARRLDSEALPNQDRQVLATYFEQILVAIHDKDPLAD